MLLESRAVAGRRGPRTFRAGCTEAGPAGLDLTSPHQDAASAAPKIADAASAAPKQDAALAAPKIADPARARSALAAAALAACAVGLLGVEGGVIWIVAGVWSIRSLAGDELGVTWGIACAGAAMRWGALGLGDVEVATRLLGPSVLSGGIAVRIGLVAALVAAIVSEAAIDGLRARTIPGQVAAVVALVTLVPLFVVAGGSSVAATWLIAAGALGAFVVYAPRYARRLPRWAPPVAAAAGVIVATVAR